MKVHYKKYVYIYVFTSMDIGGVYVLQEKVIAYRRDFHKYAESGWREFRTTAKIVEILRDLGYEVAFGKQVIHPPSVMGREPEEGIQQQMKRAVNQGGDSGIIEEMKGYTGAVATLETGRPGPVIALRFDIDSNDVIEREDEKHRPQKEGFRSVNEGMMHACGHDGHTAIGLGLAELLIKDKNRLSGTVKLIFQPAEEGVRGAKAMVDKGILEGVQYFLSGHLGFNLGTGKFAPKTEGFLSTTKIDAEFIGAGAHAGSNPEEGKNALLAAATAALNIHSIPPNSGGVTRVNVGVLDAGVGRNVIAPKASMKIETRGETAALNTYVYDKAVKIIESAAGMYDNRFNIKKMGEAITVSCDLKLAEWAKKTAEDLQDIDEIIELKHLGGSEDATFMMKAVQDQGGLATYLFFGANTAAGHHNEGFDFDEEVLMKGIHFYHAVIHTINQKHS